MILVAGENQGVNEYFVAPAWELGGGWALPPGLPN